jgi:hypothetical protein
MSMEKYEPPITWRGLEKLRDINYGHTCDETWKTRRGRWWKIGPKHVGAEDDGSEGRTHTWTDREEF